MTKTVLKFPLNYGANQLQLQKGAVPLSFRMQYGTPTLWVLVDTGVQDIEARTFQFYGTGHQIDSSIVQFVGTVDDAGGSLIWHLFEISK